MFIARTSRRFAAWIALFAILAAALSPTVSHATAGQNRFVFLLTEICSIEGTQTHAIAISTDSGSPATPHAQHFKDCPFCLPHADTAVLPAEAAESIGLLSAATLLPALFYQAPRPLFVWAKPHSRAPPHFS